MSADQDLAWLKKLVAEAHSGHDDAYHDGHGYEFHDEGSPYCPECDTAKAALAELESLADPLARCALALIPGQRGDGRFVFQVEVRGLGARNISPRDMARELCDLWSQVARKYYHDPGITVRLEEQDGPQALAALAKAREAQRG